MWSIIHEGTDWASQLELLLAAIWSRPSPGQSGHSDLGRCSGASQLHLGITSCCSGAQSRNKVDENNSRKNKTSTVGKQQEALQGTELQFFLFRWLQLICQSPFNSSPCSQVLWLGVWCFGHFLFACCYFGVGFFCLSFVCLFVF